MAAFTDIGGDAAVVRCVERAALISATTVFWLGVGSTIVADLAVWAVLEANEEVRSSDVASLDVHVCCVSLP